jgi:hypothetical protein
MFKRAIKTSSSGDKRLSLASPSAGREKRHSVVGLPKTERKMMANVDLVLLDVPDSMEQWHVKEIADFFLMTEQHYFHNALRLGYENYYKRLKAIAELYDEGKLVIPETDINRLFSNLCVLYDFHKGLYRDLMDLRLQGTLIKQLGKLMLKMTQYFKVYSAYVALYNDQQQFLDNLINKNPKFWDFCVINEKIFSCNLSSILLAPVCRLPQYLFFLGNIYKKLDPMSQEGLDLEDAILSVKQVTDEIAKRLNDETRKKQVISLQKQFGLIDLVTPSRYVVRMGNLKKVPSTSFVWRSDAKKCFFVLFNDMLMYGIKSKDKGRVKHMFSIVGINAREITDGTLKGLDHAFRINTPVKSFVVLGSSEADRSEWIECINMTAQSYVNIQESRDKAMLQSSTSEGGYARRFRSPSTATDGTILEIPEAPFCPLDCGIPSVPSLPFSMDIPKAPRCPFSMEVPKPPGAPISCFVPDAPVAPNSCLIPDAPEPPPRPNTFVSPPPLPPVNTAPKFEGQLAVPKTLLDRKRASLIFAEAASAAVKSNWSKTKVSGETESSNSSVKAPPPAAKESNDFLSQIRAGVKLRKVEATPKLSVVPSRVGESKESVDRPRSGSAALIPENLHSALQVSLERYRKFVVNKSDNVSDDEGNNLDDEDWD